MKIFKSCSTFELSCVACPPIFRTRICFRNVKFHVRKSRFSAGTSMHSRRAANRSELTKIRMLRGFRSLRKSSERERGRRVIFRNIFRMHQCRGYVSNIFTSDTVLTEESRARTDPRQVSMFFVFALLCGMLRLCAYVRTHVVMRKRSRAIRLYRSHGTFLQSFTFITAEQLALPLLMPRYGNPK